MSSRPRTSSRTSPLVRSIQKNFDQLSMILMELQKLPDIIALTETKLSPNQIPTNIDLEGYEFVRCDSLSKSGGVGFYSISKKQSLIN